MMPKKHIFCLLRFAVLTTGILIAAACGNAPETSERAVRTARGEVKYGGLFRMNISEDVRSIFPHNIVDASAFNIMNQVYEGLVRTDRETGEILPALAERYEVSADGKTYRFHIRKGVKFHEDRIFEGGKPAELTAEDVAYCFRRLCEPYGSNQLYTFVIDIIKGARKHYEKGGAAAKAAKGPEGIRVTSEGVLEIELEFPVPNFLTVLTHPCCWIFPKDIYKYGKEIDNWAVGTGPFRVRTVKMNDVIIMERNPDYWQKDAHGNSLPYLDAIKCNFIQGDRAQTGAFFDGHLDLILQVPFEEIGAIEAASEKGDGAGFQILTSPGLRVEYYGFQHRSPVYGNEYVRQAFNYAIDRQYLVDSVLSGYGVPANAGFIPAAMPGFDDRAEAGFLFSPDTAQMLLKKAGYSEENPFPVVTIQLNDGNETALRVADEIQRMLTTHLGLTVELAVISRDRHYDEIENGNVEFWRDGWIADYPDPENFLKLFHGKLVPEDSVKASYLNTVRFKDPVFDGFFESAVREQDKALRTSLFRQADHQIIERAAVIPLYYEKWIWLASPRVRGLRSASMGELELKSVWFDEAQHSAL